MTCTGACTGAPPFLCPAEEEFPTARYHVEVKLRVSPRFGIVGSSPAITPPPFLRQFAPFPYGTASVPRTWEPISRHPVYLSVPPLYDSDQADQVGCETVPAKVAYPTRVEITSGDKIGMRKKVFVLSGVFEIDSRRLF